jgi:hypothetical protein
MQQRKIQDWILIMQIPERIYRIIRIIGPAAKEYIVAGEKNPIHPVKNEIKDLIPSTFCEF